MARIATRNLSPREVSDLLKLVEMSHVPGGVQSLLIQDFRYFMPLF